MADTRKLIGAVAFSLALAGGGVAGALLGVPGTSGAQETTTDAPAAADDARPARGPHGPHLEAAAEALGLTGEELRAELEDGSTIAEVAADRGVDVNTVIDAVVSSATDHLRERITAIVNGEARLGGRGHGPGRPVGARLSARLGTVAEALGVTGDELRDELRDGQTIAEVAEAHGADVQTAIDALVAEASARIDEKVAEGDLTEEQATEMKAELTERITAMVNGEGGRFRSGRRGPGPGRR